MCGRRSVVMVAALMAMGLALFGCSTEATESSSSGDPAATLEEITAPNGTELQRVILTQDAVKRLGVRLQAVTEQAGVKVVPYSSVVYDSKGAAWVYVRPRPRAFERSPITIRNIDGEDVFLSAGPDTGTQVVTVGTAELFGAEQEIGA
jgi:hypothetical protein